MVKIKKESLINEFKKIISENGYIPENDFVNQQVDLIFDKLNFKETTIEKIVANFMFIDLESIIDENLIFIKEHEK